MIVARPSATPSTSPAASTVATVGLLERHVNRAPSTAWPLASNASAASRRVSPSAIAPSPGDTVTEPADCITTITASPEASPARAVTVVAPPPTAVSIPVESTVATVVSPLAHETMASPITRPDWSRTSTPSPAVCPIAVNRTVSGLTATVVGSGGTTVRSARPVTPDASAVTAASPAATLSTSPASSTLATRVSLEDQPNSVAPATACPFSSAAVAVSRSVSPNAPPRATVAEAVPAAEPEAAVIVAVPLAAAVTTAASLEDHATAAPVITFPFWSRTSAESCAVSPSAANCDAAGVTVTAVGRAGSVAGGSVPPSPHA